MARSRNGAVLEKPQALHPDPSFRTIVVPLADDPESGLAIPTACALAAADGAQLVGVYVIEVPSALPLEAHMFEAEAQAREALRRARAAAEEYGLRFVGRIVRAHGAAAAIVAEAERLHADLIVIAGRRRRVGSGRSPVFGEPVRGVVEGAPCRVSVIAPARVEERIGA